MMHYWNTQEGNGQSHTFCGAEMTGEEYGAFLESDEPAYEVCRDCDRLATAQDDYAFYNNL